MSEPPKQRPFHLLKCSKCGRKVKVRTNNPRLLFVSPKDGRSPNYCALHWRNLEDWKKKLHLEIPRWI